MRVCAQALCKKRGLSIVAGVQRSRAGGTQDKVERLKGLQHVTSNEPCQRGFTALVVIRCHPGKYFFKEDYVINVEFLGNNLSSSLPCL